MNNVEQYKKRFFTLMESEMGDVKPLINEQDNSDLKSTLTQLVGIGRGVDYKKICDFCNQSDVNYNNESAKRAANGFKEAISGGENPFSNFGGGTRPNEDSSAYKAGQALQNNLKSAEDICAMIKYYPQYSGADEDFHEAVKGELNYKVDSSSNLELMFGKPLYNVLKL
jgi:hypothetical protein